MFSWKLSSFGFLETKLVWFSSYNCGSPYMSSLLFPFCLLHLQTLASVVEGMSLVLFSPPSVLSLSPLSLVLSFKVFNLISASNFPSPAHTSPWTPDLYVRPTPTPIANSRIGVQNGRIFSLFSNNTNNIFKSFKYTWQIYPHLLYLKCRNSQYSYQTVK